MKTHFLHIENKKLAYDDTGTGPLIICLPSLGDVRSEYRFMVPALKRAGYRVVTMDLRGMGESSAHWSSYSVADMGADVLQLIHHLDAGPAVIIGTSKSAGSAVWAAVEEPDSVNGLILIGPVTRDITDVMPLWAAKLLFTFLFLPPWGRWIWEKYFPTLYPSQKPDDFQTYLNNLTANLKEPGRLASVRKMTTSSNRASAERLDKVKVPVEIIMGSRDPDFKDPEKEAIYLSGLVHGEYHIIQYVGHYPHAEVPDTTNPLILSFLRTLKMNQKEHAAQS
ncbi:MAG TPA: alpha/beta hydrolase [Balneolales bacterium]|nr:alpha/beta hydrolase [Balneolales bacterium]